MERGCARTRRSISSIVVRSFLIGPATERRNSLMDRASAQLSDAGEKEVALPLIRDEFLTIRLAKRWKIAFDPRVIRQDPHNVADGRRAKGTPRLHHGDRAAHPAAVEFNVLGHSAIVEGNGGICPNPK